MTVHDLIEHLKTFDPNLPVVYRLYSEQVLLESKDLDVQALCEPRSDGWVADARPDKPTMDYLVLPGN